MRKKIYAALIVVFMPVVMSAVQAKGLKVFISADMEGIAGLASDSETNPAAQDDYQYFQRIMSQEANAAVEGALAAEATEVWVRDAHGSARNILPDLLNKQARLLREWSGGPKEMMEGMDGTFSAAVFIGYHAKAGTPEAVLEHTMIGRTVDVQINGISLPEAGLNALIAGYYQVPVVFVSGDKAICEQAQKLLGEVETVAVKEGIGDATLSLHPEVAQEKIRAGVEKALRNIAKFKPYRLSPPYRLRLVLKVEKMVQIGMFYPGVKRTGDWELTFESSDLMDVIKAEYFILNMPYQ